MKKTLMMLIACAFVCACGAKPTSESTGVATLPLSQRGQVIHMERTFFCIDAPTLAAGAAVVLNTCDIAATWGLTNAGYTAPHKVYPKGNPNLCIFSDTFGQPVVLQDCAISHSFSITNTLNGSFGACVGTTTPGDGAPLTWGNCADPNFFGSWALEGFPAIIFTGAYGCGQAAVWQALHIGPGYAVFDGCLAASGVPTSNQIWEFVTHGQGTDITAQQDNLTKWVYSSTSGAVRIGTSNPLSTVCPGQVGMMWQFLSVPSTSGTGAEGFGGCASPGWAYNPGVGAVPISDQTYSGNGISFDFTPNYCDPTAGGC